MPEKEYISTIEAATILGISRVAVFKKIKKGDLKAKKVGRNYVIDREAVLAHQGVKLDERAKVEIGRAVDKTVKEYGETLKMLGDA
ncbi:helix-turn-helix domain-containing protein [Patescibacteria group bacterium]